MAQRETFLPVCKLIQVGKGLGTEAILARTALSLLDVDIQDTILYNVCAVDASNSTTSGFPLGSTLLYVSGFEYADPASDGTVVATSATFNVNVVGSTPTSPLSASYVKDVTIVDGGVYPHGMLTATGASALGVSGMAPTPAMVGELGASGVFTLNWENTFGTLPYITVTDLSGSDGYFRVAPASSAGLYTSGTEDYVRKDTTVNLNTSGYAGIVGAYGSTVVLTLQPGQSVDRIYIENQLDVASKFAISYGVIKQANPLRDQSYPEVL